MRTAIFGRIVFGGAAVLYGVIALMWHDADTWQTTAAFWQLPFGTIIGDILMLAQIVGGIGIMLPRTARPASIVLLVVYSLFSIWCVPAIIASPKEYVQYGNFFMQLSLVWGAVAVYAAATANDTRSAAAGRVARLGFGICVASFALAQIFYPQVTATLVPTWIPPTQMFWVILTTVAFALAAVAILINVQTRLATRLLTLMLALFGVVVWVPALIGHPEAHFNWSEFALNFQVTGAAWMVAELKTF